jgi:hypothetical protein
MSPNTSSSIPQNIISALSELEDEVAKVEQALLELRQKKQEPSPSIKKMRPKKI